MAERRGSWQQIVADARRHFAEGRLDRAGELCEEVLAADARDAEALELAGLIADQRGQGDTAIDLLRRAAAAGSGQAQFHYNLGLILHRRGRIEEAVASYGQAVAIDPRSKDAHNNLGFALYQLGRLDEAVAALGKALQLNPDHAEAHNNLGLALAAHGDARGAAESYRHAIRVKPDLAEAHFNLGLLLEALGRNHEAVGCYRRTIEIRGQQPEAQRHLARLLYQLGDANSIEALEAAVRAFPDDADMADELGNAYVRVKRYQDALSHYRSAVRLSPDCAAYHNNLGHGLRVSGRLDEAVEGFERALALNQDLAETHTNLGRVWTERKIYGEAAKAFERALEIDPDHAGAYSARASLLKEQGRLDDAVNDFQQSLRCQPNDSSVHVMLGNVYVELKRYTEAEASYQKAIRLDPTDPVVHSNLSYALTLLGRPEQAEAEARLALALRRDYADAHHNRAIALAALGRKDEALAARREALRLKPEYPEALLCQAFDLLARGQLDEGWAEYEWRWRLKLHVKPTFAEPEWNGSPLVGQTILLYAEQGLGDTLQFVRYATLVQNCGARVVLQCQKALHKLLGSARGIDHLVAVGDPLPPFDVQLPLLSAPRIFRTTIDTIPNDVPYLFADDELVDKWRAELSGYDGIKIGIAWQGNPGFFGDWMRSIPLQHFAYIAEVPGVQLISLQKGFGRDQLRELASRFDVMDLNDRLDVSAGAFMDTAAVIKNVDLVITSDSAVAHLAGALGAPTWVVLSSNADWRWFEEREDSPWYPTMRLFRQGRMNDWDEVFRRLAVELDSHIAARVTERAPRARGQRASAMPSSGDALLPEHESPSTFAHSSTHEPLISVVIPCYNGAVFLPKCMASVVAQESNCEIIIVDDGSSDGSLQVATELMRASELPTAVVAQPNGGPAAARNTGLQLARGKYVCFLDVDDEYAPGFFAAALRHLEADPSLVAVGCGIQLIDPHRAVAQRHVDLTVNSIPGNLIAVTEAARRIGGFPTDQAFRGKAAGEDIVFKNELFRQGKVAVIDEPLYRYRVGPGSHFDFFVDRTILHGNGIEKKWLTAEERDGSLHRAIANYQAGILRRQTVSCFASLRELGTAVHEYEQLRGRLSDCDGTAQSLAGFVLYWLARYWPGSGRVVEIRGPQQFSTYWLAAGCRAAEKEKLLVMAPTLEFDAPNVNGDLGEWIELCSGGATETPSDGEAVRLLIIVGPSNRSDVASAWFERVVPHGLVVIRTAGAGDVMPALDELPGGDSVWKEVPVVAGWRVLERQ